MNRPPPLGGKIRNSRPHSGRYLRSKQGWNHTQIDGGDRLRVVSKECLPALRRRRPTPHHVFGDRRLGNLEPQHQELAMDPGRAPLRVFLADPLDEISQATIDLRAPCPLSGFSAPESFPARAMPSKDGLRLNHLRHAEQVRPEPGHPYQTSSARPPPRSRRRGGARLKAMLS
jgi:hypothetical protein